MVPSATRSTRHPRWLQTAVNALNCPAAGWVMTTFAEVMTVPPPTGISLVVASSAPPPDAPELPVAGDPPAAPPEGVPAGAAFGVPARPLLPPQAVTVAARPARPMPASAPRRVVSRLGRGSCVTL